MPADETHRSLTAYVLVAMAFVGLVIAFLGVTMGVPSAALSGGIIILLALIGYGLRPARYE